MLLSVAIAQLALESDWAQVELLLNTITYLVLKDGTLQTWSREKCMEE